MRSSFNKALSQSVSQLNTTKQRLSHGCIYISAWTALSLLSGCDNDQSSRSDIGIAKRVAYVSVNPEQTGDGWITSTPDAQGMDSQALRNTLENVHTGSYPDVDSIVVIKNDQLVAEGYFNGYDRDTLHDFRSASKSITSALTGIAIEQGVINAEDTLAELIPNLDEYNSRDARKSAIKISDLLNMTSGFECDDWDTSSIGNEMNMYRTADWIRFVLDLPMVAAPGVLAQYCSGAVDLLGHLVATRTGVRLDELARIHLFDPMLIQNVNWRYMFDGEATGGGGMWLRPRDAAKFGQLYLNQGVWQGQRLIDAQWIERSKRSVTTLDHLGYGWLWWKRDFNVRGRNQESFFAAGNGGNYIFIFPQEQLVVVFTGSNYNSPLDEQPYSILSQKILPALR